jgi:DNA polymerase III epsilon subunit-like protein
MADIRDNAEGAGLHYTYRGSGEGSRLLWSNVNTGKRTATQKVDAAAILNSSRIMGMQHDTANAGVYKYMNAATWYGTTPQRTVEGLLNMKAGQDVFVFDMENIGTFNGTKEENLKWYSPTEIAIGRRQVNENKTFSKALDEVSLLVRPNDDAFKHIDAMIGKVQNLGASWKNLTADERRTLNDLILYGDNDPMNNGFFSRGQNGATYLNKQLRSKQAPTGNFFTNEQISLMKKGRENLWNYGSNTDQVILEMDRIFGGKTGILAGYNTQVYDIPMMNDFLDNQLGSQVKSPAAQKALTRLKQSIQRSQSLDVFQVIKTTYKNQASMLGRNLKQADMADHLGISKGTAHRALDDLNTTSDLWNHLVGNQNLMGLANSGEHGVGGSIMTGSWDRGLIGANMEVYALGGLSNNQIGEHDMVYRKKGKDYVPAYDIRTTPISKNTKYLVEAIGQVGLGQNNDLFYGARLRNTENDNVHFIARQNIDDLRSLIHQNFVPMDHIEDAGVMGKAIQYDRARRKYDSYFSSEGGAQKLRRLFNGMDALKPGATDADIAKAAGFKRKGTWVDANESFVKDIKEFGKDGSRLREERSYIESFLTQLEGSSLKGNSRAEGIALGHFKDILDGRLGRNETDLPLSAQNSVVPVKIGKDTHYITARDSRTIESGIKRAVGSGYPGKPPITVVKQRLMSIVNQLYAGGGPVGLSSSTAGNIREHIKNLREGDDYNTLATQLSGWMEQTIKTDNQLIGSGDLNRMIQSGQVDPTKVHTITSNSMKVEDPFNISASRLNGLKTLSPDAMREIGNRAISRTSALRAKAFDSHGNIAFGDEFLNKMFAAHDEQMAKLKGFSGVNLAPRSAHETLSELAKAFSTNNVGVGIFYDDNKRGLVLALADKAKAEDIFKLAPNEIIQHQQVATINVPLLNERGQLVMPGQSRAARLTAFEKGNVQHLGTGFDMVIQNLVRNSKNIRERIGAGNVTGAHSLGNYLVRNTLNSLSINNKRMSDVSDIMDYDASKSAFSKWGKKGHIDVSSYAEEWFRNVYDSSSYSKKSSMMTNKNGMRFVDTMDMSEYSRFNREIDGWLRTNKGLNVNMHSVKDTHASQVIRSTRDYRELNPLGFYNPTAGERVLKSVNYMPLDETRTAAKLGSRAQLAMTRGLTTEQALQAVSETATGRELGYLNLRAAYMETPQLAALMKSKLGAVDEVANTYEGVFVMADDVANGFHLSRQKNMKVAGDGMEFVNEKLRNFILNNSTPDDNGNYMLKSQHDIKDLAKSLKLDIDDRAGSSTRGQITVGALMRDGEARETYRLDASQGKTFLKGFDVERNALIFDTLSEVQNGTKFVTASGERVTAVIKERSWFNQMGINADTILPGASYRRGMGGSAVASQVELVMDEANRMIQKNGTVGGLTKIEMMNAVNDLMEKHLNIKGNVKNGQIVLDGLLGSNDVGLPLRFDGSSVSRFLKEASTQLKINDFSASPIHYGQEAVGVADVYEWENDMGRTWKYTEGAGGVKTRVEGYDGLVRWGIKEQEAIKDRASRYLGGSNNAVSKWLNSHVSETARAQTKGIEHYAKGLISSVLDIKDQDVQGGRLKSGEVVISTRGNSFSVAETTKLDKNGNVMLDETGKPIMTTIDDANGLRTGRIRSDNVTEVSLNAFKDPGKIPYKGYQRTAGDYQNSLIQMGQTEIDLYQGNQKVDTFKKRLEANGGTALFELPDDSISGRRYVRFLDADVASIGLNAEDDMPVLNELQRAQLDIVDKTKAYQGERSMENRVALQNAVKTYDNQVGYVLSSSRSGSISDKLFASKMDMSGRFRVQTLAPVNNGAYKEGSLYVSRERMGAMIKDSESDIAKNVFGMDVSKMDNATIKSSVLAKIEEEGLYGFVNRYPTIHESTNAVLKVEIDKSMKEGERAGRLTVGTAAVMKADSDGDFISNVFAHYRAENAKEIHDAMSTIHEKSVGDYNQAAKYVMNEVYGEAGKRNVSIGELWNDAAFREKHSQFWQAKIGDTYDAATGVARLGKADVGILDNTRERLTRLTNAVSDVLQSNGRMDAETAIMRRDHMEEFGRLVSQNSISSKKFDGITAGRDEALQMLREGINNPTDGGIDKIRKANNILGVFNVGQDYESEGSTFKQRFSLDEMLGTLSDNHNLAGKPRNWLSSPLMRFGYSEGMGDANAVYDFLNGEAGVMAGTPQLDRLSELDDRINSTLTQKEGYFSNMVLNNFDTKTGSVRNSLMDLGQGVADVREMIDSAGTVADKASNDLRTVASKFMGGLGGGGAGGMGAIKFAGGMFAGIWGASALLRSGPTPEETVRGKNGELEDAAPRGSAMGMLNNGPTARITPQGENINISINAKDASRMSQEQVSALVQQELNAMMPMQVNMNTTVNDNTQNIDKQWLQDVVAQAMGGRII